MTPNLEQQYEALVAATQEDLNGYYDSTGFAKAWNGLPTGLRRFLTETLQSSTVPDTAPLDIDACRNLFCNAALDPESPENSKKLFDYWEEHLAGREEATISNLPTADKTLLGNHTAREGQKGSGNHYLFSR